MGSPNKLPLLKKAFRLLVKQLRPIDRVSIVVYAGAAGVVLEPTKGDKKAEIINALDQVDAGLNWPTKSQKRTSLRMAIIV